MSRAAATDAVLQDANQAGRSAEPDCEPTPGPEDPTPAARIQLFVVHAIEDGWFVEGFLLQALRLPDHAVLVSSKLEPGAVIVREIERGAMSPVTVVVMSPALLTSPWAQFAHDLAVHQGIETADTGGATLIPAILADCALPLVSRSRIALDFRRREREHWEAEAEKLRNKLAATARVVAKVPCPYPGIRPFTTDEAARFHGRDSEVGELLGRLRNGQRELYVIGPSGSGKSSLVAAGLVPRLRQSPALAGGAFVVREMRPGAAPTAALAGALGAPLAARGAAAIGDPGDAVTRLLADHLGHDRVLIVIDPLEELFTVADSQARAAFIAAVRALRADPRVALVLTLRADFYASLMESALWDDLDGRLSKLEMSPLRGDRLRQVIEAPAHALGVHFEPVLVQRLLHDVADEPGALPLLQDTLLTLWHQRTRGLLRLADYEAMSDGVQTGLAVTVARRANHALNDLSPARREIARRVLLRLVQFGDGTATTRRQQPRAALSTAGDAPEDIDAVVRHLADHRLITTSGGADADASARIDLAHEILLSTWPTLGDWIRTRRDDEQRRRVLEAKAAEWVTSGRGQSRLLDADELHEIHGWLNEDAARDLGISDDIQRLVSCSEAALHAQRAAAEARRRRWRRWVTAALVVLTAAVAAVSTLAVIARQRSRIAEQRSHEAQRARQAADQSSQALQGQLMRDYVSHASALLVADQAAKAAPYLLAARDAGAAGVSLGTMFRWASQGLPRVVVRQEHGLGVAWSPDGTRVATASEDHTARIWNAVSGQPVTPPLTHGSWVLAIAWSPDGTRVATASDDHTARVWDAVSGRAVTLPLRHEGSIYAVAWSPDGRRVATASKDATARVWDAASGRPVAVLVHRSGVLAVAWSPDGRRLVTASQDGTARVWNAASGRLAAPALAHRSVVAAVAWSPDGTRVATASADGTARVWDAASGRPVTPPLTHQSWVDAIAWSPDGRRVATASEDQTARVWDAIHGRPLTRPLAHQGRVSAVAWSPDGQCIATASEDHTARVWDAASGQPLSPSLAHQGGVKAVAWSPDGRHVATASADQAARVWDAVNAPSVAHGDVVSAVAWRPDGTRVATASNDGTAQVWDAVTRKPVIQPLRHHDLVRAVAWSPDGTRVATASNDGTARVWDAVTGQSLTGPLRHRGGVTSVAWSPDGTRVATASLDSTGQVWEAASGKPVTPPLPHAGVVMTIAWSPDGTRVVTASGDRTASVWDAVRGTLVTRLAHRDEVLAIAWSPDGMRVATASADHTARVWDARTGQPVTPPFPHQDRIRAVAWSPDGARVATGSDDQTARVWDAMTGQPVTSPLAHQDLVQAVAWSPDGTRLATASNDRTAQVWDAITGQPVTRPLAHQDYILAVAWSPDGTRVATASEDHTARVWDVSADTGTRADWYNTVERGDYRLRRDGVLILRDAAVPVSPSVRPDR